MQDLVMDICVSIELGMSLKRSNSWRTTHHQGNVSASNFFLWTIVLFRILICCCQYRLQNIPNLAVLALAKDERTVLLVVIRSTSSCDFL
jgi:hypothetical protein